MTTHSARATRPWYAPIDPSTVLFNDEDAEFARHTSGISNVYDAYRAVLRRRMRSSWERQTLQAVTKRKAVLTWTILTLLLITSSIVSGATCRGDGIICGLAVFTFVVTGSSGLAFAFFFRIISQQERIADETPLIQIRRPQHPAKDRNYQALTMDEWMLETWSASVNFSAEKGPPKQCHICFEDLQTGEWVRILPCTHHYHHTCITEWSVTNQFRTNPVCPHCKYNIRETPLDNEPAKKVEEFLCRKEREKKEQESMDGNENNNNINENENENNNAENENNNGVV